MFSHPSQAMKAEEGSLWIVKVRIHIWLIWEGNLLFFGIFYETRFRQKGGRPEIDISVSKLLGFETFANFLRVSVSVSENLVLEKSLGFDFRKLGLGKFGLGKKVSVSENLVSEKKSRFQFRRIWSPKKSFAFRKFGLQKKVSVLVSENLVSEKK